MNLFLFLKFKKNQNGASLIEMLIGLAVVSLAMLGLATQMNFTNQASKSVGTNLTFVSLVNQLQEISNSSSACSSFLNNTPVPNSGDLVNFTYSGLNYGAGLVYDGAGGKIRVTQLQWSQVFPINSFTEVFAYMSLQADLTNGTGETLVGGNTRSYPAPGANPPGILFRLRKDPNTGLIVGCGPVATTSTINYSFTFPITTTTINDDTAIDGATALPAPGFPTAGYVLVCGIKNSGFGSAGKYYGAFSVVTKFGASFNWHYFQGIGDFQPPGTVLNVECMAHN